MAAKRGVRRARWVKEAWSLRRFAPIPGTTKESERLYKGRMAVDRVRACEGLLGGDDWNVTGAKIFHAYLGAVSVLHLGLATLLGYAPRQEPGTLGVTRLGPVPKALRKRVKPAAADAH